VEPRKTGRRSGVRSGSLAAAALALQAEGLGTAAIARTLGVTRQSIWKSLHRARQAAKEAPHGT
jgi:DNA-directed RNA polymerase specialized sigma24 family protein